MHLAALVAALVALVASTIVYHLLPSSNPHINHVEAGNASPELAVEVDPVL
jgi:hypothetical protein